MGRGAGKAQWQTIELLAAFKAGEAACDRAQVGSATVRGSKAAVEYAGHVRLLAKDAEMQQEGITFVERLVGKEKLKWDLEMSIMSRTGADVLKKHKLIMAYIRKHIMPGYHAFYTKLDRDTAIQCASHAW